MYLPSLVALILALSLAGQEPVGGQDPVGAGPVGASREASAAVPGQIPDDASPESRALWQALLAATLPENRNEPIRAFRLKFDIRARPQGKGAQSNDVGRFEYLYLGPGWVRMTSAQTGLVRLRGPQGDWIVQKDGKALRLQGREFEQDKKELDDTLAIARTFVALTDPRSVRITRLARLVGPPREVPPALAADGASLEWLSLTSPDFHASAHAGSAGSPRNFHVQLGLGPDSHLPRMALIQEERPDGTRVVDGAVLVHMSTMRPLNGFQVPTRIKTYQPVPGRSPWAFGDKPTLDLAMEAGSSLRPLPAPGDADFTPPPE